MAKNWHIGCSGFYYNHWKGIFYPEDLPKKGWFEYYQQHFNTLELNVSFYRFPPLSIFESWHKKSFPGFSFAVKAPRLITHYKQFHETEEPMKGYYSIMKEGLQEKLGAVLFQCPPRFSFSEERLENITRTIDTSFPNVIEFRNESWWTEKVYKKLEAINTSFCGISHPLLPDDVIINTDRVYYRYHGVKQLYASRYSVAELKKTADYIKKKRKPKDCFIFFNNDIGGSAIYNAREMIDLIGK